MPIKTENQTQDNPQTIPLDNPTARFIYWMMERHRIHLKRQAGLPKPWTTDKVLQSYFFTNPFRENDKTTAWYRENIRIPYTTPPHYNPSPPNKFPSAPSLSLSRVLFATIAFRWFNFIPTGQLLLGRALSNLSSSPKDIKAFAANRNNLLYHWDMIRAINRLTIHQQYGHKIFTGAYIIKSPDRRNIPFTLGYTDGPVGEQRLHFPDNRIVPKRSSKGVYDKIEAICWAVNNVWLDLTALTNWFTNTQRSLEEAHQKLCCYPYLGDFMAYEIVSDLRFTPLLDQAPDINTWANMGPGATRGLRRLRGLPAEGPLPRNYKELMLQLWDRAKLDFRVMAGPPIPSVSSPKEPRSSWIKSGLYPYPNIEMREIEHSLCEFDKYERARLQDGQLKRLYQGT